jgi:hypothetical protein
MNHPTEIEWVVYDTVVIKENKEEDIKEYRITKNAKIYRTADSYIDITELRLSYPRYEFAKFKKFSELEKEVGVKLIKVIPREGIKKTFVHERILENVLRWYELDEINVINKFVIPQIQICKQYINNKIPILVHIKKQYASASEYCLYHNKQVSEWKRCKSTEKYINNYAKVNRINTDDVVKQGLGYNSRYVWIPCELLPCLAQWCSCDFNLPEFFETLSIDIKNIALYHNEDFKIEEIKNTNNGYVYCVSNPLYGDVYKIGCTKKDPNSRVKQLNSTNIFVEFKLEFSKEVDDCYATEKELHTTLAEYRVRADREFFKTDLDKIKKIFDEV